VMRSVYAEVAAGLEPRIRGPEGELLPRE